MKTLTWPWLLYTKAGGLFNWKISLGLLSTAAGNVDFGADKVNAGGITHMHNGGSGNGPTLASYFESSREVRLKISQNWPGPKTPTIHV